jgi:hypothetical protein
MFTCIASSKSVQLDTGVAAPIVRAPARLSHGAGYVRSSIEQVLASEFKR